MISGLEFLLCFLLALISATSGYVAAVYLGRETQFSLRYGFQEFRNYFTSNDDEFSIKRRKHQLDVVLSSAGVVTLVNFFNASILAFFLVNDVGLNVVWWAMTICLMAYYHLGACLRLQRTKVSVGTTRRVIKRVIANIIIFGFVWGVPAVLFYGGASQTGKVVILLALLGTAAGGAAAYAILPPAALMFCSMIGAQVVFVLFSSGGSGDIALAALALSMLFTIGAISAGVYQAVIRQPTLRDMGRQEGGHAAAPQRLASEVS